MASYQLCVYPEAVLFFGTHDAVCLVLHVTLMRTSGPVTYGCVNVLPCARYGFLFLPAFRKPRFNNVPSVDCPSLTELCA